MKTTSKNRCMYALVTVTYVWAKEPTYRIEPKHVLKILKTLKTLTKLPQDYAIVCDDQPLNVLRGMLKLLKEKK